MVQIKDNTIRPGCEHFPRSIDSLDELPEAVREKVVEQADIRRIIYVPSHEQLITRSRMHLELPFRWRKTPHYTLVFSDQQIMILDGQTRDDLRTHIIPVEDLCSIRYVSVLLYMYIEIRWAGMRSEPLKVEFSTVGERMMKAEFDCARAAVVARSTPNLGTYQEPSITHIPYKFQTYTCGDLLPGESIWFHVYEPRIRMPGRRVLQSSLSPNRAVVLTEHHMLVLEDRNRRFLEADISEYWMERCHIPRTQVRDIRFEDQPDVTWVNVFLGENTTDPALRFPLLESNAAMLRDAAADWLIPAVIADRRERLKNRL